MSTGTTCLMLTSHEACVLTGLYIMPKHDSQVHASQFPVGAYSTRLAASGRSDF